MSPLHLKPNLEVTKKIIDRDFAILAIFLLSIIFLAVYAFIQDWNYKPVFIGIAIVAFLFMGDKKDFPDDNWTPQQKGAWSKRYTTLKLKNDEIIYVFGDGPKDQESSNLSDIKNIGLQGNKMVLTLNQMPVRKINTKYWSSEEVSSFVKNINQLLSVQT